MKPEYGPIAIQALVMGAMTVTVQMAVYGGLALAAGKGREALTGNPAATAWIGRAAGALLMVAAAFALWEALRGG
jgi:threonine/homoserine/homoserine lactone efflux protein